MNEKPFDAKEKAKALIVLMVCATQDGLIEDLFPPPGEDPDLHTHFGKDLGADEEFLKRFISKSQAAGVDQRFAAQCRALVTSFSTIADNYSGSYCPNANVLSTLFATVK